MTQKSFSQFTWGILIVSILIPLIVWGTNINWQIGSITLYQWFPLFGLLAWMVMWTHYVSGAVRVLKPTLKKPPYYGVFTAYLVLGCLLLHPGLLAFAQAQNKVGLPPLSFYEYVGEGLKLAVIFGSIALLIFLSFEVFSRMKNNKFIMQWSLAISISQSVAMVLIFVHGLRLGSNLNSGWFYYIWILYGIILLPSFYIIHTQDFKDRYKNE
jgi:hypothetical protein